MSLQRKFKKYQQKYYAPGSPLRYLRKAVLAVRHPGSGIRRSRLGETLTASLSPEALRRVAELNQTGYTEAGEEIDGALLTELEQATEAKRASGADGAKIRSYFSALVNESDLNRESIFVRFALQPAVREIACAYFDRKVPYLADVQVLMSHGTDNKTWEESQLWHRDYADSKTIKLWVYLTDVDSPEKGPFTYLPLDASNRVKNNFFPGRVSDEAMISSGLAKAAQEVYGRRRKAFYIDTSRCYHLGSRLKQGEIRIAYVATFISHRPLYPFNNRIKTNGELPEVEKLLLSL
jgi:hypothetical protein